MPKVKPIPDNYPQVMPYLSIDGAAKAIDFYKQVFGATERMRMEAPGGKIGHAELEIGNSVVMLADVFPESGATPGKPGAGSPVSIMVYVEDVDAVWQKAVDAGANGTRKVEDQFYGDRAGGFEDPFGHHWHVASHVEDVPPEEMERRAAAAMGGAS
jgi:PhnB protein